VILWQRSGGEEEQAWVEARRVGEVGGGLPGYWGGAWSPCSRHVIAYSHSGALYAWALDPLHPLGPWAPSLTPAGLSLSLSLTLSLSLSLTLSLS
jgi:hypothetical protein